MAFAPTNKGEVEEHSSRLDDFGFNSYLLPNNFEDDKAFWGYVSDARAELATSQLTFSIPPTIESAATSYTDMDTQPTASTARSHATESIWDEQQNVPATTLKNE